MDYVKVIVEIAYKIIKVIKKEILGKNNGKDSKRHSQNTG